LWEMSVWIISHNWLYKKIVRAMQKLYKSYAININPHPPHGSHSCTNCVM
jgi:hypothetical protein